jgi:hypothetical protein
MAAYVAMIATGIASILGGWESLFSNRRLWRVNNIALTGLYEIRSDIEYREKAGDRQVRREPKYMPHPGFAHLDRLCAPGGQADV